VYEYKKVSKQATSRKKIRNCTMRVYVRAIVNCTVDHTHNTSTGSYQSHPLFTGEHYFNFG